MSAEEAFAEMRRANYWVTCQRCKCDQVLKQSRFVNGGKCYGCDGRGGGHKKKTTARRRRDLKAYQKLSNLTDKRSREDIADAIAALLVLDVSTRGRAEVYTYVKGVPVYGWHPADLDRALARNPEFDRPALIRDRKSDFATKVTPTMRKRIVSLAAASGLTLEIQKGAWLKAISPTTEEAP